jgi:hypothetical protein
MPPEVGMTVYVDDMHRFPVGEFRRMKMSHMIATSEAELHAMARQIGLLRAWYQGDHYDVSLSRRALAVRLGAVEISLSECAALAYMLRTTGRMGTIDEALALRRERSLKLSFKLLGLDS